MSAVLARRLAKLEVEARDRLDRRWRAAVDRIRETMDPEHARLVADWLRANVDGKRHGLPCDGDPGHVCPQCLDRLDPPALARAVWFMLLDHMATGAPVAMPPNVAEVYLHDCWAYPTNRCEGCDYLMPTQSTIRSDGTYRHGGWYRGSCPCCGLDNHPQEEEEG